MAGAIAFGSGYQFGINAVKKRAATFGLPNSGGFVNINIAANAFALTFRAANYGHLVPPQQVHRAADPLGNPALF